MEVRKNKKETWWWEGFLFENEQEDGKGLPIFARWLLGLAMGYGTLFIAIGIKYLK